VIEQTKIALRNAGSIDPRSIDAYQAAGGFQGLKKALTMDPEEIVQELEQSGLRGRGGGGFPTGLKVKFTRQAERHGKGNKYVVCNADEGEPGTFKDRVIMEGDPHLMVEGMIIGAFAIQAEKGYVYIRGEYVESIARVEQAIKNCYERGYLGSNILDSGYSFDLEVRLGAGSYLCGEELTLLESLEGKRGYPRIKPPFPANQGVFNAPTLINNVETFAHMPVIVAEGGEQYKKRGTEKSPGTKIFTLSGDVKQPGYYEVVMGTTLGQLIYELGGGMKNGHGFKAALLGGAAGTFVDESVMDTPMGFDTLREKGATLGSGAVMVMDASRSLYEMMHSILDFFAHESCGKCVPCRVGTRMLLMMWEGVKGGSAGEKARTLEQMQEEAEYMQENSLCPLGGSPIISIKSAVHYFRDEF